MAAQGRDVGKHCLKTDSEHYFCSYCPGFIFSLLKQRNVSTGNARCTRRFCRLGISVRGTYPCSLYRLSRRLSTKNPTFTAYVMFRQFSSRNTLHIQRQLCSFPCHLGPLVRCRGCNTQRFYRRSGHTQPRLGAGGKAPMKKASQCKSTARYCCRR